MKAYEARETERTFFPMLPIYARLDGRGFSKFTRGMHRPYDERMSMAMIDTAKHLVKETGALMGYTQSDEISLVWMVPVYDEKGHEKGTFFEGKVQKLVSVCASLATSAFTKAVTTSEDPDFRKFAVRMPHFDARVIQLPSEIEAANMFLWRETDAYKNAVSMAAQHHFSHKSLQGVGRPVMLDRLKSEAGVEFEDYHAFFKRGSFLRRVVYQRPHTADEMARIPAHKRPVVDELVTRSEVRRIEMPPFNKVINRTDVIFRAAEPIAIYPSSDSENAVQMAAGA